MTHDVPDRAAGFDAALSRWLDGEARPDEARRVEERLAADPRLRAEVERLRADLDLFRADARPRADVGTADRVMAAVAAGESAAADEERFHRVARRWSAAAAVLIAVGVGGSIAVGGRGPAPDPDDEPQALTSLVESRRLDIEVDFALDQRPVAPTDR